MPHFSSRGQPLRAHLGRVPSPRPNAASSVSHCPNCKVTKQSVWRVGNAASFHLVTLVLRPGSCELARQPIDVTVHASNQTAQRGSKWKSRHSLHKSQSAMPEMAGFVLTTAAGNLLERLFPEDCGAFEHQVTDRRHYHANGHRPQLEKGAPRALME